MIRMLLEGWTKDFAKNKVDFEERMLFVIKIIEERSPVILR
jgi:hypothetical protein